MSLLMHFRYLSIEKMITYYDELADRNPPECKRASSAAEHRRYSDQCVVNSVSGPLEKAIYASCPASSQMSATWRTWTYHAARFLQDVNMTPMCENCCMSLLQPLTKRLFLLRQ